LVNYFRGLKALWSATILICGSIIQHNFVEEHTTTGLNPCNFARQKLDLGENHWLELIKMSC